MDRSVESPQETCTIRRGVKRSTLTSCPVLRLSETSQNSFPKHWGTLILEGGPSARVGVHHTQICCMFSEKTQFCDEHGLKTKLSTRAWLPESSQQHSVHSAKRNPVYFAK